MNSFSKLLLPCLFQVFANAQVPEQGSFQVRITPKEIKPGDSVWVEAGKFAADLCPYSSTYSTKLKNGGTIDTFMVTVNSISTGGECALAYGYSGPSFYVAAAKPGIYLIEFDSLSQFKADMGDTGHFTAAPETNIQKIPATIGRGKKGNFYQVNGSEIGTSKLKSWNLIKW